jgi:hypothetical protein
MPINVSTIGFLNIVLMSCYRRTVSSRKAGKKTASKRKERDKMKPSDVSSKRHS